MLIQPNEFLNKPSIQKHYRSKLNNGYPHDLIDFEKNILIENIKNIQSIWSYISIDIICNNIDFLEILNFSITEKNSDWILRNIKIESFLNMIGNYYRKVGCIEANAYIKDVLDQLEKLIAMGVNVTQPKRWRMIDFHDHISYLYLENTTKNNKLKTLIDSYNIGNYIVSQPKNSLDIIIWGKKVKNCVASYEERIGETIWIFFIEKDGLPLYTVETDMTKNLNIKQIKSQCNGIVASNETIIIQKLILDASRNL